MPLHIIQSKKCLLGMSKKSYGSLILIKSVFFYNLTDVKNVETEYFDLYDCWNYKEQDKYHNVTSVKCNLLVIIIKSRKMRGFIL